MDSFDYIYLKCFDGRHSGHGLKKVSKESTCTEYFTFVLSLHRGRKSNQRYITSSSKWY